MNMVSDAHLTAVSVQGNALSLSSAARRMAMSSGGPMSGPSSDIETLIAARLDARFGDLRN